MPRRHFERLGLRLWTAPVLLGGILCMVQDRLIRCMAFKEMCVFLCRRRPALGPVNDRSHGRHLLF